MKKKLIKIYLTASMLFCLISCGTLNRGVIVEKRNLPARTLYANGVYNQRNDRYLIILEGNNAKHRFKKAKIYVSKQAFDSLDIGSLYIINK